MDLFDTQIISYAYKRIRTLATESAGITSITAQEFLLVQTESPTRNAYYLPRPNLLVNHPSVSLMYSFVARRFAKEHGGFSKRHTDSFVVDLPGELPTVVEYSHSSIADALNRRNSQVVKAAVEALPKRARPTIHRRLEFLLDSNLRCVAFSPAAVPLTTELVLNFVQRHHAKANFRNTLNDIASVAVASLAGLDFHTEDRLLAQFMSDATETALSATPDEFVLHFDHRGAAQRQNKESRGYVNRPRILREGPTAEF